MLFVKFLEVSQISVFFWRRYEARNNRVKRFDMPVIQDRRYHCWIEAGILRWKYKGTEILIRSVSEWTMEFLKIRNIILRYKCFQDFDQIFENFFHLVRIDLCLNFQLAFSVRSCFVFFLKFLDTSRK